MTTGSALAAVVTVSTQQLAVRPVTERGKALPVRVLLAGAQLVTIGAVNS